jgi:nicotinamidase/pyrazinamidase
MEDLLVVVDMLNDFIHPDGKLYFPKGAAVVEPCARLRRAFHAAGLPVIHAADAHPADSREFADWPPHCLAGSWGSRVIDELAPAAGELVAHKDAMSLFSHAAMDRLLKGLGVKRLHLCGVATEYCVQACALDAAARGYDVTVVVDAIAGVDMTPGASKAALEAMTRAGVRLAFCDDVLSDVSLPL